MRCASWLSQNACEIVSVDWFSVDGLDGPRTVVMVVDVDRLGRDGGITNAAAVDDSVVIVCLVCNGVMFNVS